MTDSIFMCVCERVCVYNGRYARSAEREAHVAHFVNVYFLRGDLLFCYYCSLSFAILTAFTKHHIYAYKIISACMWKREREMWFTWVQVLSNILF